MEGFINEQKLLTIKELSGHLNVSVHTVYSWVRRSRIPYLKLNGLLRFESDKIEKWLDENRSEGTNNKKIKQKEV